ncbi:MAG: capsule assembly Wzi family protein [Prolixibacteraceae bacterium]|nr:capsule assembly Wzi family protein [Prolixibacteraceae bacterium]
MKLKHYHILLLLLVSTTTLQAQNRTDSVTYSINSRFTGGTGTYAPFLSTANQYDRYSFSPNSLALWGTLHKKITAENDFDYGFGVELDGNVSAKQSSFFPGELYIQGKLHFLNMYAGMKQEVFGNQDPELSSGGMLWSANSRPIPKIAIASNGYTTVPWTKGYVEFNAGLSHGWMNEDAGTDNLLLHHKYAYIRIGGTSIPVNLSYGVQHVAQWGGQSEQYGTMPVNWDNYYRIFLGKSGSSSATQSDQINTLGNHIISQNLGLDVKLPSATFSLYWQNLTEEPPVKLLPNSPNREDGLWGISVKLSKVKSLNQFVLEYLSTTDHNGPWHDLDGVIYGGLDPYYISGQNPTGWTYKGMTIGNPWLTSPKYNEDGSASIKNNTVRLYYFSGKGTIKTINYRLTLAYSENYGMADIIYENRKDQFSWLLESSTAVRFLKNTQVKAGISGDHGDYYGNNLSLILGVSYSGSWGF